jgi:hypothetical protein
MILNRKPTSDIKKAAREEGMRFLREFAVERVMQGISTLREINKVTFVESLPARASSGARDGRVGHVIDHAA